MTNEPMFHFMPVRKAFEAQEHRLARSGRRRDTSERVLYALNRVAPDMELTVDTFDLLDNYDLIEYVDGKYRTIPYWQDHLDEYADTQATDVRFDTYTVEDLEAGINAYVDAFGAADAGTRLVQGGLDSLAQGAYYIALENRLHADLWEIWKALEADTAIGLEWEA